jgi:hypothetical protein
VIGPAILNLPSWKLDSINTGKIAKSSLIFAQNGRIASRKVEFGVIFRIAVIGLAVFMKWGIMDFREALV